MYKVRVKDKSFGRYSDENTAAVLEDAVEMQRIDAGIVGLLSFVDRQKRACALKPVLAAGGGTEFRVRF
jgi:hypothetical protein